MTNKKTPSNYVRSIPQNDLEKQFKIGPQFYDKRLDSIWIKLVTYITLKF